MNHRFFRMSVGFVVAASIAACAEKAPTASPSSDETTKPVTGLGLGAIPAGATPALTGAHEAYLAGDFVAMGERLREVLLDPNSSDLAKQNAFELLEKAFEVQGGSLPSAFRPPAGISGIQYACRRFTSAGGRPTFQIRVAGTSKDASQIVGLTVRHAAGGLVMDKQTGQGAFAIRHDPFVQRRGLEEFVIDSPALDVPPADGVVSLRLELRDGTVSEGFLIAHGLGAMASPTIVSPAPAESIGDPNPLVRWTLPALSPSQVPFERRRSNIHVIREGQASSVWEFSSTAAGDHEVRLGSGAGTPETALTPGSYRLDVGSAEARFFGPVEVLRSGRTSQSFHVVTQ